jgi:hypothetical protein
MPSGIPLSSFWKQGGWGRLDAASKTPPPYPRTLCSVAPLGRESQRWTAPEESLASVVWRAIRSTPDRATFLSLKRSGRPADCFDSSKSSFKISTLSIPKVPPENRCRTPDSQLYRRRTTLPCFDAPERKGCWDGSFLLSYMTRTPSQQPLLQPPSLRTYSSVDLFRRTLTQ